jgi:hypothetical protein
MTIQELINELQKVEDKNTEILVKGIDPTGWVYENEIKKVELKRIENDYYDEDDEESGEEYKMVFMIDAGMF